MDIKWIGAHRNNYGTGRSGKAINKIVLHWIVGSLESADATFANPDRKASAHYGIGDKEVHQYVREEDTAWHASNLTVNRESIGIEHEGGWLLDDRISRSVPTNETHKTSAKLVAEICQRYNIPIDREHITAHREYRNTQCPGSLAILEIIEMAKNFSVPPSLEITNQTKIPQIENLEVQAIRSQLNDLRRNLENAESACEGKINSEIERTRAEEIRVCISQKKQLKEACDAAFKEKEVDWQKELKSAKLKYEKLLIKKVEKFSGLTLFRLGIKKLFKR